MIVITIYKTIEEMEEGLKEEKSKRDDWIKRNVDSKYIDEIREYNENIDMLNAWIIEEMKAENETLKMENETLEFSLDMLEDMVMDDE